MSSAVQAEAARINQSSNDALSREVSSGLTEQSQYQSGMQAALREQKQWQQALSQVNEQGFSFTGKLETAVKRFMMEEEGRSASEVSAIINGHNMGNIKDTQQLAASVSHFAQKHGLELAAIKPAPASSAVTSDAESNLFNLSKERDNVATTSSKSLVKIQNQATPAGIPSDSTIKDGTSSVLDSTVTDINSTTENIKQQNVQANQYGEKLHETVQDKQRIYSAGQAPSIHETMDKAKTKLTNKFKELFN